MGEIFGVINIHKEKGCTSHDVVAAIRKKFGVKKAGHAGTLDPQATGVLPVCLGAAVKIADYISASGKRYRGQLILGVTTDTQDHTGRVLETRPVAWDMDAIKDAVVSFTGDILQKPPMYSAVKVGGKKLYEWAREGITIERADRPVRINKIDVISVNSDARTLVLDVDCEKGVYIRALCADIGEKLGCGGCMGDLVRTRCGFFDVANSVYISDASERDIWRVEDALGFPSIEVKPGGEGLMRNGNPIPVGLCECAGLAEGTIERVWKQPVPVAAYPVQDVPVLCGQRDHA